jgi:hypothetical protein
MNKQEILDLLNGSYSEEITKSNEWFQKWIDECPVDKRAKAASEYIKRTIGLLVAAEEILSGNYKNPEEFMPKEGEFFNPSFIKTMQEILFKVHYRIALVNREAHRVLNNINPEDTLLDEVADLLEEKNQADWLVPGFWPQYLTDLNVKTELDEQ